MHSDENSSFNSIPSQDDSQIAAYQPGVRNEPAQLSNKNSRTSEHHTGGLISRTQSHISQRFEDSAQDQEEVLKIIESHKEGVENVLSRYETYSKNLGPVESAIDQETPEKFIPDPNSKLHPEDKWQYPLDVETGFRVVQFVEDDREDPRCWSTRQKWNLTILLGVVCFAVALMSAIITGDMTSPAEYFGVSSIVMCLCVSLMVWGFGVGPLLFAPLSEEFGRNWVYHTTLLVAVVFIVPCAVAKNIGTLLAFRFLDGLAFSAPMCLIGGSLSDMWRNEERGVAMSVFSAAPFIGPVMGPIIGSLLSVKINWRWPYYFMIIFSGCLYIIMVIFLPETHHQTILKKRAQRYIDRGEVPPAELRLIPMMIGSIFVPVGLFAYAWSSFPHVSWAGPCFSGMACGFGFLMLYNPANNYIVDSYQHYAASGLAAKTFVRSMWGGAVPLFTIQMYHRLGYEWATTLMAFISLACVAIPFMFYIYGARIRKRSKYAYSPAAPTTTTVDDVENGSAVKTGKHHHSSNSSCSS